MTINILDGIIYLGGFIMSEEQFIEYIKKEINKSLDIVYEVTLPNKEKLDQELKDTFIALLKDENLFYQLANCIKHWSYIEASRFKKEINPDIAKSCFDGLRPVEIRDFIVNSVKNYELQNNRQTR